MTKRKAITDTMKIQCLIHRGLVRCGICDNVIPPLCPIEWDHVQALVHGGEHAYANLRPVHAFCHLEKTKRDIAANAKVKRILADKPSKNPMKPGRGFDKTKTRGFDGVVRAR